MNDYMIALFALLIFVFGARALMSDANKKLTSSQKAELIDIFGKSNLFNYAVLILLLGLFFMNMKYEYTSKEVNLTLYIVAIIIFVITSSIGAYRKLKEAEFPMGYIRAYLISTALRTVGLVIFFALIVNINP